MSAKDSSTRHANAFQQAAVARGKSSLVTETWYLVRKNKKWWLLPIMAALIMVGTLFLLSGSAAAPFIYTLF